MRETVRMGVAIVLAAAMGCDEAPSVDIAAETRRVEAVMDEINTAWESEDLSTFSRLVTHGDDLVCFGTDTDERWVGWEALEAGLRRQFEVFSDTMVEPRSLEVRVDEGGMVAWVAQEMEISTSLFGAPVTLLSRITAVLTKQEAGWRLVQFHYSVPISESAQLME